MNKTKLNIAYLNLYHLYSKVIKVNELLISTLKETHILGISETRLKDYMDNKQLHIANYSIIRRDKTEDGHTGIAAYIHDSMYKNIKRRTDLENKDIETLWLEIKQEKSIPSLICFIYRNPKDKGKTLKEWQKNFQNMIDKIPHKNYELQILGDLNINLLENQTEWNAITAQLGLDQLIKKPTRETTSSSKLIDHIYTNTKSKICSTKVIQTNVSDHYTIQCSYLLKIPKKAPTGHKYINYRSYKHFDEKKYLAFLSTLPFENIYQFRDPFDAIDLICNLLKLAIDKHVPIKSKRVKQIDIPVWLSNKTIEEMRNRKLLNKKTQKEEFQVQRNLVNSLVEKDRKNYVNKTVEDNKDTKTIWRAINTLTNSNKKDKNTKIDLEPNEINDFFLNLPQTILTPEMRELNDSYECPPELLEFCNNKKAPENFTIPFMTIPEVGKRITKLKNTKAVGPDEIPVKLLKIALPHIIEPLTYAYNLCIEKNCFPSQLKEAKVIPLPKSQDTSHPKNLRPISLLPILSKPLEGHIHKHMYQHLNKNNLIHKYQSGFRPKHSCQTALVKLIDSWLSAINKKETIGTVYLDFKKAFDLVNHNTLISKLKVYFPNSQITKLIESYLTNRSQFVLLNGKTSNKRVIQSGVPQGSVLGPLFFIVYINDLPLHLNKETENTLFADDSALYTANRQISTINNTLQDSLNKTHAWCNRNSMVIHPDKTKSMLVAPRQKLQIHKPKLNLTLDISQIEEVKEHKMLGITIDSGLTWNKHIENLIKKLAKNTYLLCKLKKYVKNTHLHMFFNAQIISHINYSSTIWDGCSQDTFKKLNSVYKRAVKQLNHRQTNNTDETFKQLDILPLKKHLEFNKTILTHKIYYNQAPAYLTELLDKPQDKYNTHRLRPPRPRIDLCENSLSYSGSVLWNRLPPALKTTASNKGFKRKLRLFIKNR